MKNLLFRTYEPSDYRTFGLESSNRSNNELSLESSTFTGEYRHCFIECTKSVLCRYAEEKSFSYAFPHRSFLSHSVHLLSHLSFSHFGRYYPQSSIYNNLLVLSEYFVSLAGVNTLLFFFSVQHTQWLSLQLIHCFSFHTLKYMTANRSNSASSMFLHQMRQCCKHHYSPF